MPFKVPVLNLWTYTKAEIDQMMTGGFGASLANRNAMPIVVASGSWTLQSGGDQDGWYWADVTHGRATASIAYVACLKGADNLIFISDGINIVQREQSTTAIRIWLQDEPSYNLLCLVVYA